MTLTAITVHTKRAIVTYKDIQPTEEDVFIDGCKPFTICRIQFQDDDCMDRVDLLLPYGGRIEEAKP